MIHQFAQFSRTLANAAINGRRDVADAYNGLSQAVTAAEQTSANQSFPFFSHPYYEHYADNFMKQGKAELATLALRVKDGQYDDWIAFVNKTYEQWVYNGHMYENGNLDRLDPIGYAPHLTKVGPDGIEPAWKGDKEEYWVWWNHYPAPATYKLMNWDFSSVPGTCMKCVSID